MKKFIQKIYLGFLHVHVLYHASHEPFYGAWMIEELKEHGYQIGPSHIYPMLKQLVLEGLLEIEQQLVDGHVRKYYHITDQGREVLFDLKNKVKELSNEVFEEDHNGGNPDAKQ